MAQKCRIKECIQAKQDEKKVNTLFLTIKKKNVLFATFESINHLSIAVKIFNVKENKKN